MGAGASTEGFGAEEFLGDGDPTEGTADEGYHSLNPAFRIPDPTSQNGIL